MNKNHLDHLFVAYPRPLNTGRLIKRYKRFFADVFKDESLENLLTLHCPNTGAMTGLLNESAPVRFLLASKEEMIKRKTPGTLEQIAVQTEKGLAWVGVNTHRANFFVQKYLESVVSQGQELFGLSMALGELQKEVKLSTLFSLPESFTTRVDFMIKTNQKPLLIEVKSVTYWTGEGEQGLFPDAKSERAKRQLKELIWAQNNGYQVIVLYLIQHENIQTVCAAKAIDPEYDVLCQEALSTGVQFEKLKVTFEEKGVYLS